MEKIPTEVLMDILVNVADPPDWSACSLVSRYWNSVATPLLFRLIVVHFVPCENQIAAAKRAEPSIHNVQMLATFLEFVVDHPTLAKYAEFLMLDLAPHDNDKQLPRSYAVDSDQVIKVLECLPNLKVVALNNVFFSRRFQPRSSPTQRVRQLKAVTCHFSRCCTRRPTHNVDVLDVLNLFQETKHLALDSLEDESEFTARLPAPGPPVSRLRFSTLRLRDTTGAEGVLASLLLSGLKELFVEYTAHKTLRWLSFAGLIVAPSLKKLAITAIPDTIDPKRGDDYTAFDMFSRARVWPSLRELYLTMFFVPDVLFGRAWFAIAHFLQSLTVSAFPRLSKVYLSLRLEDPTKGWPAKGSMRGLDEPIRTAESVLLRLHEEARFDRLTVAITGMAVNRLGATSGHLASYNRLLQVMFARLHKRGMLVLQDESARLASEQMSEIHPDPDPEDEE